MGGEEVVFAEPEEDVGLPHPAVPDDQQLGQIVIILVFFHHIINIKCVKIDPLKPPLSLPSQAHCLPILFTIIHFISDHSFPFIISYVLRSPITPLLQRPIPQPNLRRHLRLPLRQAPSDLRQQPQHPCQGHPMGKQTLNNV